MAEKHILNVIKNISEQVNQDKELNSIFNADDFSIPLARERSIVDTTLKPSDTNRVKIEKTKQEVNLSQYTNLSDFKNHLSDPYAHAGLIESIKNLSNQANETSSRVEVESRVNSLISSSVQDSLTQLSGSVTEISGSLSELSGSILDVSGTLTDFMSDVTGPYMDPNGLFDLAYLRSNNISSNYPLELDADPIGGQASLNINFNPSRGVISTSLSNQPSSGLLNTGVNYTTGRTPIVSAGNYSGADIKPVVIETIATNGNPLQFKVRVADRTSGTMSLDIFWSLI